MTLARRDDLHLVPSFDAIGHGCCDLRPRVVRGGRRLDAVYVPIGLGSGICGVIAARDLLGLGNRDNRRRCGERAAYALSVEAGRVVATNQLRRSLTGWPCASRIRKPSR